ncbi:MAG: helix-turn-helix domain-containing protein [Oscillospiraceae bacterium]
MNRLKELREFHALTQERAAKIGYIVTKTYVRYENGERVMPLDTAVFYAKFYNVSLDYLAGVTDQTGQSLETELSRTVGIVPQLMSALGHLSDEQQLRLADFLNSVRRK